MRYETLVKTAKVRPRTLRGCATYLSSFRIRGAVAVRRVVALESLVRNATVNRSPPRGEVGFMDRIRFTSSAAHGHPLQMWP